jgi:hypothetical protein
MLDISWSNCFILIIHIKKEKVFEQMVWRFVRRKYTTIQDWALQLYKEYEPGTTSTASVVTDLSPKQYL